MSSTILKTEGNAPLTEKRFIELFTTLFNSSIKPFETRIDTRITELETRIDTRITGLETRMTGLETRMTKIEKTVLEIKGFQTHEAAAIEFELQSLLDKHLRITNPFYKVTPFSLKRLYDPITDIEITELDAAFLLYPTKITPDHSRLLSMGISVPVVEVSHPGGNKFVLVEAKHYMAREKIIQKMEQFEKIRSMFHHAAIAIKAVTHPYSTEFMKTVRNNPQIGNIDHCILFFGAAYWEKGLLQELQNDVKKYKNYMISFSEGSDEKKLQILRGANKLESKWGLALSKTNISGALGLIDFIVPSGNAYVIPSAEKAEPLSAYQMGGLKTRKKQRNED